MLRRWAALRELAVWEVVQQFIKPATVGAQCSCITAFNSNQLKDIYAALLAPTTVGLEPWAADEINAFHDCLQVRAMAAVCL